MPDYQKLYLRLFNGVETALRVLEAVEQESENVLLEEAETCVYVIHPTEQTAALCQQLAEASGYGRDEVFQMLIQAGCASLMTLAQLVQEGKLSAEELRRKLSES